jgi:hypothetical protein
LTPKPHNLFSINYSDQLVQSEAEKVNNNKETFEKALRAENIEHSLVDFETVKEYWKMSPE